MVDRRKFIKETALTTGVILSSPALPAMEMREPKSSLAQASAGPLFQHGVASGDPLANQVIIWTRINPAKAEEILVRWNVSKSETMDGSVVSGEQRTDAMCDFTVKVDVKGLSPSTVYYYQFSVAENKSAIGRTRTAPADTAEEPLEFAVISCTNYSAGFYNALARIAQRTTLHAVIHLGDYIYEGTTRNFDEQSNVPDDDYESTHFVKHQAYWQHFFRRRYSINRLDPDLQAAHRQHPFITIWDDHETADNAYRDGARGHNPEADGEWEDRKSAARQAYFEWMPIRVDGSKIYRIIRFGKLMELVLLDTRLEGRDKQIYDATDPARFDTGRTLLGKEQKNWLFNALRSSSCQWKVIANQVIFSEINVRWAESITALGSRLQEFNNTFLDYWEGYPAERDEIIQFLTHYKISNTIVLSASMHCAMAFDVTARPTQYSRKGQPASYDPVTGHGSVAVEFASPSVTSANLDEQAGSFIAGAFERMINRKLPMPIGYNANPHMKFADVQRHGYFMLKIDKDYAEAGYYFLNHLLQRNLKETLAGTWRAKSGSNRLQRV